MSGWSRLKQMFKRLRETPFLQSPTGKIIAANTAAFILWKFVLIPEQFMVKHFAFERFNIQNNRFHTMITYAFSHHSFLSFLFDMIILGSFGRAIAHHYGNKMIWWIYLLGAFFGACFMHIGMPRTPGMIFPQVGADAPISAMLTFYGLQNLYQSVMFFFFPVRMWVLLGLLSVYSLFEPSKKNFGGVIAGLTIYQMYRFRMI